MFTQIVVYFSLINLGASHLIPSNRTRHIESFGKLRLKRASGLEILNGADEAFEDLQRHWKTPPKKIDKNNSPKPSKHKRKIEENTFHNVDISNMNRLKESNGDTENRQCDKQENNDGPVVTLSDGSLRGTFVLKYDRLFYYFLGIPYAEKPVRFQPPVPVKPWNGIKNALDDGPACPQLNLASKNIVGDEDCLALNVYTSTLRKEKLPVIVWIYSEAFKFGYSNSKFFDPIKLLAEDVVFVAINYRLGLFGFFCMGTEDAPGNLAFKDIVLALRWIKKNIHKFGGDNDNITLYGLSSGSMIVDYLSLSPMAEGLFNKTICHSGSALTSWGFNENPRSSAFKLGKYTGIDTINEHELVKHLQSLNTTALIEAELKMCKDDSLIMEFSLPFVPCAEKLIPGQEIFLEEHPEDILKSGKYESLPALFGFNDKEGLFILKNIVDLAQHLNSSNGIIDFIIPPMVFKPIISLQSKDIIVKKVKEFYFYNKTLNSELKSEYIDLLSDVSFLNAIHRSLKYRSQNLKQPLFYYEFAYDGPLAISDLGKLYNIAGVGHMDDIGYVFSTPMTKSKEIDSITSKVSLRLIKMYTNFAKYGNPTPKPTVLIPIIWHPIQSQNSFDCLKISTGLEMKKRPNEERNEFWSQIYPDVI